MAKSESKLQLEFAIIEPLAMVPFIRRIASQAKDDILHLE